MEIEDTAPLSGPSQQAPPDVYPWSGPAQVQVPTSVYPEQHPPQYQAPPYVYPLSNQPQDLVPPNVYLQVQRPTTIEIPQKVFKVLGSIQICIGFIFIVLNIAGIASFNSFMSLVGYGIWCGIFFCVTGSLTVVAAIKRTTCLVVACMVMSIIASTLTMICLGFGASELGVGVNELGYSGDYYYNMIASPELAIATGVLMIVGSITEATLAIVCAGITCWKTCCRPPTYKMQPINPTVQYTPGKNIVVAGPTDYVHQDA